MEKDVRNMDAEKYLEDLTRMCKYYERMCEKSGCPLAGSSEGNANCVPFMSNEKGKCAHSIKIVKGWAKDHPAMTNGRKFHETFGILSDGDIDEIIFSENNNGRYGGYVSATKPVKLICVSQNWWNEEYKEP
jgi:hypothetical protein